MHRQHLQRQNKVRQALSLHRDHATLMGSRCGCLAGLCPGARMWVAVVLVAVVVALLQHVVRIEVEAPMQPGLASVPSTCKTHVAWGHGSFDHYRMHWLVETQSPPDCQSTDRPSISSNTRRRAWCPFCCSPRLSVASCSSLPPGAQHDLPRQYSVGKACMDKSWKSEDQNRPPWLHPYLEAQRWQEQMHCEWKRTSLAAHSDRSNCADQ